MSYFKLKIKDSDFQFKVIRNQSDCKSDLPPLIMLHDSFGCIELWRDFPEKLSLQINRDIFIYDRQGYGKSDSLTILSRQNSYMEDEADLLILIMKKLKIPKAILFGHSDGGTIALIAASKYPQKVLAVISEAAHVFVERTTVKGIEKAVYAFKSKGLKERLEKYHSEKTERLFKLWSETWLSDRFRTWNILESLPHIVCPVLIIQGENDEFGTKKQVESIYSLISGEKSVLMIPNTGHTPHKEAQDLTLIRTKEFIQSEIFNQ